MRTLLLLPLALATAAVAGCGTAPGSAESAAARAPRRDLTLQLSAGPAVHVASQAELVRPAVARPAVGRLGQLRRPAPGPAAAPEALEPEPTLADPLPAPAPAPAETGLALAAAGEPADPRALAPGQTVTLIPAGGGPSTGQDWTDELPARTGRAILVGVGGGGCDPRGSGGAPSGFRDRAGRGWRSH